MTKALKTILRPYMPEKIRVRMCRFGRSVILFPRAFRLWIKYLRSPHYFLPGEFISNVKLSFPEFHLYMLDGWYHDFEALGLKTGVLHPNQRCKQGPLFELINRSISLCRERSSSIRGVDLFCANGYYTNYAVTYGAQEMYGIDHNNFYIAKARLITRILGNSGKIRFECGDVFKLADTFDFCICAGGLYHISNPHELLQLLSTKIRFALAIQTVYSLEKTSYDYFETPAPGWTWGCRFSYHYLLNMVKDSGWRILSKSSNQLEGNSRLKDRGSAYLLCIPDRNNHS